MYISIRMFLALGHGCQFLYCAITNLKAELLGSQLWDSHGQMALMFGGVLRQNGMEKNAPWRKGKGRERKRPEFQHPFQAHTPMT